MTERRIILGQEVVECECGVWRLPCLPCWNETSRPQITVEAMAQASQAFRNFGYQIAKALRLVK